MTVRPDQLVLRAGGASLQRYGTLRKRTAIHEEIVEDFSRASTGLQFGRDGVLRSAEDDALRVNWRDLDDDGERETATVPLEAALTNLCEFNIPGAGESGFELVELDAVTNLTGEHGIRIEEGDDYRVSAPSNWDPNDFVISGWVIPDWDSGDGKTHVVLAPVKDADNNILLSKQAGGTWIARLEIAGTNHDVTLTPSFSAGDAIYVEMRWDGTTLTLRADTDQDGSLESSTDTPGATFGDNSGWTLNVGQDRAQNFEFEGAINLLITDDGSASDPGDDRFNSGNGMALEDWLATVNDGGSGLPHSENLVLHVGGNSDGSSVQLDTFAGASQLLSDPEDGGYDFDGSSDEIDFGAFTASDGQSELTVWGEIEAGAGRGDVLTHWDSSADGKKNWRVIINSSGELEFQIATDGSGGFERYIHGAGDLSDTRMKFYVRFKGDEGTNADKVQVGVATYQSATRDYGSWDTDTLGDASTPATLRTPTAVNLIAGNDAAGALNFGGSIYDLRLNPDTALDTADLDAQELDQAYHDEWDHWWPLEGDADDQIGSLNGTINGATSVTDGRSLSGRFERYTRQGRYNFDGSNDDVNFGAYTDLDGAVEASFWGEAERDTDGVAQEILTRWDNSDNAKKQFVISFAVSDQLRFAVATDGAGSAEIYDSTTVINAGDRLRWFVRFKGDEATNADRVQIGVSKYDPATGTYGAWTTDQVGDASTPGSLRTPTAVDLVSGARANGINWYHGKIDELRINAGTALSIATLEANTIYSRTDGDWDHAWPFDGDANDAIGSLDGTVTGAQQVADGRQPKGWSIRTAQDEVDRATGSNQVSGGTYGLRLREESDTQVGILSTGVPSVSDESWVVFLADARNTEDDYRLEVTGLQDISTADFATVSSLQPVSLVDRKDGTGTPSIGVDIRFGQAPSEAYLDDLRAYELATVSPSTATKGTALPSLDGFGNAVGVADAEVVDLAAQADIDSDAFDAGISGQGQAGIKVITGPTGSNETRRYRWGLNGRLNSLSTGSWYSMVVGVYVPDDSAVTPANVQLHVVDDQASTAGDAMDSDDEWQWLYVQHQVDGSATEAYFELRVHDGGDPGSADAPVYIAQPTIVAGRVQPMPQPNDSEGTAAQATNDLTLDYVTPPVAASGLIDFIERGTIHTSGAGLWYIGKDDATGARLYIDSDGTNYRLVHHNGSSSVSSTVTAAAPSLGDRVKLRWQFNDNGSVQLHQTIESGSEESGSASAALSPAADWGDQKMRFGAVGNSNYGHLELIDHKTALGADHSLSALEAAA